jgi:hypothetical protein
MEVVGEQANDQMVVDVVGGQHSESDNTVDELMIREGCNEMRLVSSRC